MSSFLCSFFYRLDEDFYMFFFVDDFDLVLFRREEYFKYKLKLLEHLLESIIQTEEHVVGFYSFLRDIFIQKNRKEKKIIFDLFLCMILELNFESG
eukprot:snap_masked-scaffold_10-processed-gene-2.27-mRNA-1 protein AED:0.42 eAED:1.00 QI:0/0/0/1/1/1/3/0/95